MRRGRTGLAVPRGRDAEDMGWGHSADKAPALRGQDERALHSPFRGAWGGAGGGGRAGGTGQNWGDRLGPICGLYDECVLICKSE